MDYPNIRKAGFDDIHLMAELFKLSTDHMISLGIHQWNYTYPLVRHVEEDIHNGSAFVYIEGGKIAGTITLDSKQDDQYKKIHWHNHSRKVLVIHRLSVHPGFHGFGIGKKLCWFAEKFAIDDGLDTIRLDAYSLNPVSNQLYKSLGYRRANGYCYFHNNAIPFYCYDKKIM
jgi:GNAT superfamily N-acetyltransferase